MNSALAIYHVPPEKLREAIAFVGALDMKKTAGEKAAHLLPLLEVHHQL